MGGVYVIECEIIRTSAAGCWHTFYGDQLPVVSKQFRFYFRFRLLLQIYQIPVDFLKAVFFLEAVHRMTALSFLLRSNYSARAEINIKTQLHSSTAL